MVSFKKRLPINPYLEITTGCQKWLAEEFVINFSKSFDQKLVKLS